MLSEEVIDKVVDRLVNRIEITNEYVLKEIGKSIKEVGTITPSKRNQLIQMLKYGGDFDKIVKKIAKITDMNVYDIYKIFDEIAKNDYRFAKQFYDYKKKKYIPYELNEELQRQIRTLASMTAEEYLNLTNTKALGFGWVDDKTGEVTFKGLKKAYYDLLDEAVLSISEGKETFYDAMYRQLKKFGDSGLKVVYESGRAIRLDSAVRMCVKSGLTNMHMEMQKQIGEEFGSDGVEITVHNNPAPDHEEAQGCQFSTVKPSEDEPSEWEKLQTTGQATTYDGKDIDMIRYHSFRPIGTMNCYHYTFSIVLGVNKPQYSDDDLQKIRDKNNEGFDLDGKHYSMYEGTQMQRQLESAIRTQKDNLALGKASGNQKLIDKSEAKLRQLNKKYNELNQASGLRPKLNRLKNVDYGVKPGQNRAVSGIDNAKDEQLSISKTFKSKELFDFAKYQDKFKQKDIILNDDLKIMDEDLLKRNIEQLDYLSNKYNVTSTQSLEINMKANANNMGTTWYRDSRIGFNKKYYSNKETLVNAEEYGQKIKWHNQIKEENLDLYTATHEFGHTIENDYTRKYLKEHKGIDTTIKQDFYSIKEKGFREEIDYQIRDELFDYIRKREKINITEIKNKYFSGYGKSKKHYEWFAETFTQLELGEQNLLTEAMKDWLERNAIWKM